jgi:predicted nucleotidyltransferase
MPDPELPGKIKSVLDEFVKNLQDVYKTDLISAILYGSAASGEFSPAHSNVNLAVVLCDTSLTALGKIAPIMNKRKFRVLNTVFFTEGYIKSSCDVFPVEFLDMKENHNVLYGKDVFNDLAIDTKNLRFQCEQELKSKIINIKRTYIENIKNPDLDKFLIKFFTSSLHLLRNILMLKTGKGADKKEDILNGLAAEFHIDIFAMKTILQAKCSNKRLPRNTAAGLFNLFVRDLESIANLVDGMQGLNA